MAEARSIAGGSRRTDAGAVIRAAHASVVARLSAVVATRATGALLAALLTALALPPPSWSWLAWVALVPLLLALRKTSVLVGLGCGLLYGAVWGALAAPSLVHGVLSLPALGLLGAAGALLLRKPGFATRLGLAALWAGTELVRARLSEHPWGILGYSQHAHTGLIQAAAVTGVYGVTFIVALINAGVTDTVLALYRRRSVRRVVMPLVPSLGLVATMWAAGLLIAWRGPVGGFEGNRIAIVQGEVPPGQLGARLQPGAALVVWPESAAGPASDPSVADRLVAVANQLHADLLLGPARDEDGRTRQSVRLIAPSGRSERHEDARAHHGILLRSFVPLGVTLDHDLFHSWHVAADARAGASLLVHLSNDERVGMPDAFEVAAFRAVETRRYLVHATATGVSGVIDPYGRVVQAIPAGTASTAVVPVAGRNERTPYARFGDVFGFACVLFAAGLTTRRLSFANRQAGPGTRLATASPV